MRYQLAQPSMPTVLAKDRACSEYNLTLADLDNIPCSYRSCHGNGYKVWKTSELRDYKDKKKELDRLAKIKEEEDRENALIAQYGVEGLRQKRDKEAQALKEKERQAAAEKKRSARCNEMVELMVNVRKALGDEISPPLHFTTESIVAKPQAKSLFGLTDTVLRDHCKDLGPFARSKSSYRADDLVKAALNNAKTPPNLLVQRMQMETLKLKYPDLIYQASEGALRRIRADYNVESAAAEEARRRAEALTTSATTLGRALDVAEEEVRAFKKQRVDRSPTPGEAEDAKPS